MPIDQKIVDEVMNGPLPLVAKLLYASHMERVRLDDDQIKYKDNIIKSLCEIIEKMIPLIEHAHSQTYFKVLFMDEAILDEAYTALKYYGTEWSE